MLLLHADVLIKTIVSYRYTTHHAHCFLEDPRLNPDDFVRAHLDRENADWDKLYEHYDAAVDWPTVAFYKDLYKKYPNAKFILTIRSADPWYKSVKNTVHLASVQTKDFGPDHPLYSFGSMCKAVTFDGALADPVRFSDEEAIKKLFTDHNEEVKKTIPADQLYIMELGSGWEGLCKFLGKEVPKESYPNSNSTSEFQKRVAEVSESKEITADSTKVAAAST